VFVGHFGVALAARPLARDTSLGALVLAAAGADVLWPLLVLTGVETARIDPGNTAVTPIAFEHYPWSHSLVATVVLALCVAGVSRAAHRSGRAAGVLAALVVSHWVLDALSHGPDVPLSPWSDACVGLGIWNSRPLTVAVEGGLLLAGAWAYARTTTARDRTGVVVPFVALALLAAAWVGSLAGPPPPGIEAVAVTDLGILAFVALAAWGDRHRTSRRPAPVA